MSCVGFMGLGNMGHPMATRLRNADYELVVQDVRRGHAVQFAGTEANVARTPKELADRADIVLLSLPTPAAVRSVVLDEHGLARGSEAGR